MAWNRCWRSPVALLSLVLLLSACSVKQAPRQPEKQNTVSLVKAHLPADVQNKQGWAEDISAAISQQKINPVIQNLCAVIAITGQESGFNADAPVSGVPAIAWGEINRRAATLHIPEFLVRTALKISSPDGRSYAERLDHVRSERELSAIFDDLINSVPMGQRLFGRFNPIHTGGPMQVSISFAEQHASDYPYSVDNTIRQEVFTRRGGIYFGTLHLLGYKNHYPTMLYRFADYNAGWFASRNAAFQTAVTLITGRRLALDGDLIRYDTDKPGNTELALQSIADQLDMSQSAIRRDLNQGEQLDFEDTQLWQRVYALADRQSGHKLPRERLPSITLESPKISRQLTTAWFAQRVNQRYQQCLKQ